MFILKCLDRNHGSQLAVCGQRWPCTATNTTATVQWTSPLRTQMQTCLWQSSITVVWSEIRTVMVAYSRHNGRDRTVKVGREIMPWKRALWKQLNCVMKVNRSTSRSQTMKSAKTSKSEDEFDEDTPSKETLDRRRDRKLKDDITNMMVSFSPVSLVFIPARRYS